jgi:hypothetical protein
MPGFDREYVDGLLSIPRVTAEHYAQLLRVRQLIEDSEQAMKIRKEVREIRRNAIGEGAVPPDGDKDYWRNLYLQERECRQKWQLQAIGKTGQCDAPPEGWECSRAKGHDGPCAAHPIRSDFGRGDLGAAVYPSSQEKAKNLDDAIKIVRGGDAPTPKQGFA